MKTIIIPTDFSRASEKGVEFGIEIAKKTNASILLLHSIFIPALDINVPADLIQSLYHEEEEASEKKLRVLSEKIQKELNADGKNIQCSFISQHNVPAVEIEKIAEEKEADLVILGTKGRDDFWGFMDSTTMEALKNLKCPVLVVKEESHWNKFHKVACGIETINEDLFQLKQIIPAIKPFNSEISVIHVEKHAKNAEDLDRIVEKREEAENFLYAFKESINYSNINFQTLLNEDPSEGIADYLEKNNSDLLILLNYKRNWLEKFFHQSLTKKIIANINTPVLVIHKKTK